MKYLPIIYSAEEVCAIMAGTMTQTRRVMKKQPVWVAEPGVPFATKDADPDGIIRCPFGPPGTRLWCKEVWAWSPLASMPPSPQYPQFVVFRASAIRDDSGERDGWWTAADAISETFLPSPIRWRSPVTMPRWASRLTIENVGVRVERVRDITSADAIATGVGPFANSQTIDCDTVNPRDVFARRWDSIHGPGAWDRNDRVWVMDHKLIGGVA